ncbi:MULTISPECIES: replication-associated recombination protein A [unclassified Frankia]|uniref:replication-associated recombination protein A n=1 Tax=unclassified Frankia TaxID=2632575 RepID=UPI001EF43755|nr:MULTISPECIES: replication-associated recombination protein A [unclassified Frankia]
MNLFDAGLERALATSGPLAARLRPRTLDDVVGQRHLLAAGSPLRRLVEGGGTTSVLLWGPPGTGKTTLAHVIAGSGQRRFRELSAVTAGVKDVRAAIDEARDTLAVSGARTVLFIDEVHRFTRTQQDALLPAVENGLVTLVAATTENPFFAVVAPLLSRSLLLTLEPLTDDDIRTLISRALADPRGYGGRLALDDDAVDHVLRLAGGDARRALTVLQAAGDAVVGTAGADAPARVDLATVEQAVNRAAVRYDRAGDQHYDVASAFIKSIRGGDADAALHYLARMLEAGEDPRFIARRMIILASEDVGLAEPGALGVTVAAAQALELVGLPEARLALAQAVIHLALAPKSNAVIRAVDAAIADVRAGRAGPVPAHLRDAHYPGAGRLGHGGGYRYPHDHPGGVVGQQYAPDPLVGRDYYQPGANGFESRASQRLAFLRATLRGAGHPTGAHGDVDEPAGASGHEAGRAR